MQQAPCLDCGNLASAHSPGRGLASNGHLHMEPPSDRTPAVLRLIVENALAKVAANSRPFSAQSNSQGSHQPRPKRGHELLPFDGGARQPGASHLRQAQQSTAGRLNGFLKAAAAGRSAGVSRPVSRPAAGRVRAAPSGSATPSCAAQLPETKQPGSRRPSPRKSATRGCAALGCAAPSCTCPRVFGIAPTSLTHWLLSLQGPSWMPAMPNRSSALLAASWPARQRRCARRPRRPAARRRPCP